jgi:O-phosphoseryl-tRNA(Cys) synthetase
MSERLKQIKADYKRGRMSFENMEWLISEVDVLDAMTTLQGHVIEKANARIKELESDGRKDRQGLPSTSHL